MTLRKDGYRDRLVDNTIGDYLKTFGAISIEGPKWCGKTWTGLNHSNSVIFIDDPRGGFNNRRLSELDPEFALKGKNPHLIDEWQDVPPLWDAVRHKVDASGKKGMYILTGSATPNRKNISHSGAGRIGKVRMHTMSLYESGDSNGEVSLLDLFEKPWKENKFTEDIKLEKLVDLIVRGGWPGVLGIKTKSAMDLTKGYLEAILDDDIRTIDGIQRDGRKMLMLLKSLARNESTVVSNNTLIRDMSEIGDEKISYPTLSDYLDVLKRLYIIVEQPAFNPNLRSSVRVGKSPKRRFIDQSLAIASLGATPEMLIKDLNTLGFMFESLCMRDLTVYAESFGGKIHHYRDSEGREIDAVVELSDGRWGAFEIKLGANQIDKAAENLLKFDEITSRDQKSKRPSVLCVICGLTPAAYKRDDGVYVIPITALKN